jgi:hypothetical protein
MSSLVSEALRQRVAERADFLCEYCLLSEADGYFRFQVDYIISRKHGGQTSMENLAFACPACNRFKGSDLGTISVHTRELTRFFNPRTDFWPEHFRLVASRIDPLTEIAAGTVRILELNNIDRVVEREALIELDRYPSLSALAKIRA